MRRLAVFLVVVASLGGVLPPTPSLAQAGGRPVRSGDRGPAVSQVQTVLSFYGYTATVDGRFGPQTERAVRHWQRVNGLTVDGVVGPQTLASLDMTATGATATVPAVRTTPPPGLSTDPETIIRELWPDDVEDRAVAIAYRESRLQPSARNACCYGLFQIHWSAHRRWLADLGVTAPADLLDARTNVFVALVLWQQAGWGPWTL